ncbi:MAG: STAS domain-containing protein [Clostridia bacterium]|jgi:stage II sporulation protein AA (anti-sigma F factor antagonist)|nr:STAS domain-containing protein [Clostridia bacterium]
MPVTIKFSGEKLVAYIQGEVDHHTAPDIRDAIDDAILVNEKAKTIVLDFSRVSFMDSSGVGLVMGRYRLAISKGKSIAVENLTERDYKIMKMSGIERLAPISRKENNGRFGDAL